MSCIRITAPRLLLAAGCAAALLAGCATLTDDECRRADWTEIGRSDGLAGHDPRFIGQHQKACAKAGVMPDVVRWQAGWQQGARSYCTPRTAWAEGLADRSYRGACRDFDEAAFLRWHRLGKDLQQTRALRDSNRNEIGRLEAQLKKATTDDERKTLRDKIRNLDQDQARLRRIIEVQEAAAPPG